MLEQTGNVLLIFGFFCDSTGAGVTGLTVTVDAYRVINVSGTPTPTTILTAASATEIGGGFYAKVVASSDNTAEGAIIAIFKTTSNSVRDKQIPSMWSINVAGIEDLDATISSRASSSALATVQSDTDDIQTRLPSALVSGRIDASVGAMAANVLTATAINTDAITAAKIATDAIGASELAADAVTEIVNAVLNELLSGHTTTGTVGKAIGDIKTDTTSIQADTDDIQTRIPSALVGGKIDSHVNDIAASAITATSIATDAITAAKIATDAVGAAELAADAVTEIVNAVLNELLSGHTTAGTVGKAISDIKTDTTSIQADTDNLQTRIPASLVSGRIDASVGAVAADAITASSIAPDAIGSSELAASAVNEIADQVWDELLSGHAVSGSTGEALTTVAAGGGVSVGAIADAVWDELLSGHVVSGSAGAGLSSAASGSGGASTLEITNLTVGGQPYRFYGSQHDQSLSGSVFGLAIPAFATAIMLQATGEDIYLTWDGDTPSSSVGMTLVNGIGWQILYLDPDRDDTTWQFLRAAGGAILRYQFLRPL